MAGSAHPSSQNAARPIRAPKAIRGQAPPRPFFRSRTLLGIITAQLKRTVRANIGISLNHSTWSVKIVWNRAQAPTTATAASGAVAIDMLNSPARSLNVGSAARLGDGAFRGTGGGFRFGSGGGTAVDRRPAALTIKSPSAVALNPSNSAGDFFPFGNCGSSVRGGPRRLTDSTARSIAS